MQAALCGALITLLLAGGGVFFYYTQTIALNELKAQSDFVAKRRAEIDTETGRVQKDKDELSKLAQQIAALSTIFSKLQQRRIGYLDADTTIRNVHFADATHGWAVGDKGTILATADGGATWQKRDSGTSNFLFGVHFADATHGWAVASGTDSGCEILEGHRLETRLAGIVRDQFGAIPCDRRLAFRISEPEVKPHSATTLSGATRRLTQRWLKFCVSIRRLRSCVRSNLTL